MLSGESDNIGGIRLIGDSGSLNTCSWRRSLKDSRMSGLDPHTPDIDLVHFAKR